MAFYISNTNATIPCIKLNNEFNTIDELYDLLEVHGWEEMTVYSREQWNPTLKCAGQCNATALLVQEYFGGEIINYPNPGSGKSGHCFNRIDVNGTFVDIDLTSDQFTPRLTGYATLTKKANFGYQKLSCERAAYILKRNLGL